MKVSNETSLLELADPFWDESHHTVPPVCGIVFHISGNLHRHDYVYPDGTDVKISKDTGEKEVG